VRVKHTQSISLSEGEGETHAGRVSAWVCGRTSLVDLDKPCSTVADSGRLGEALVDLGKHWQILVDPGNDL
jgi:hypothetical protein